jgi:hypothetical protein
MAYYKETDSEPRRLRWISLLVYVVLVAGCGSGAVTSPDQNNESSSSTQGGGGSQGGGTQGGGTQGGGTQGGGTQGGGGSQGGGSQGGETKKYHWVLPPGDTSPTGNEGSGYGVLMDCQGAEQWVADAWSGFNSPRNLLMYMAAAHLCHGDIAGGRPFYSRAVSDYGLAGLDGSRGCDVYRSVASVLLQAPRESFPCPGGEAPQWKTGPEGQDNPLTVDVDESQPSTGNPGETSTSSPGEASTTTSQGEGTG